MKTLNKQSDEQSFFVKVYDTFAAPKQSDRTIETVYMVMEYVDGKSLMIGN
jgi:hypothetical protein